MRPGCDLDVTQILFVVFRPCILKSFLASRKGEGADVSILAFTLLPVWGEAVLAS